MAGEEQAHHKKKKSGLELLDKEELLEACKQETSLIKFCITKITHEYTKQTRGRRQFREINGEILWTFLLRVKTLLETKLA